MPAPTFLARSLTDLISLRASTQPHDAAIHTGAAEFGEKLLTLTYSDVQNAVDRLCHYYSDPSLGLLPSPSAEIPPEQIVAVLTSTAIDESLLEIAMAKLGLAALLLSVNNSVAAVAHLCKITRSHHLIYGTRYESLAQEAQAALQAEGYSLAILPERRFPLWGKGGIRESTIAPYPARLTPAEESRRTAVVLHSSGSTGFPKPVYITHYGMIANLAPSVPQTGFSALPLFHGFGHFSVFRCIYHGKTFTLMPPHLPLTSANICRIIRASPSPPRQHFAVPYVLKMLAETDEGLETLASFDTVSYAGAAVPDDLGDRLVAAGVPLISFYGTTETGALLNSRRDCSVDKAWNWVRAEGLIEQYLELNAQGGDTFEIIVRDGWPAKIVSNREDGAYCTKDLFQRHPEHRNWFKYIGRLDDTLTQTLGEKTNPVPIELAIRGNSPLIAECIVFGDARPQTGALILPSDSGAELSKDTTAFIKAIWPVIEDANSRAPTHSRIQPEMVAILPYGTEIPVATKMSILRPACYKKFAPLIEGIYERFEKGSGDTKRVIEEQAEMEVFLKDVIVGALGASTKGTLNSKTDLFAYGVDSLQATKVRNIIGRTLDLGNPSLGQNIVYEHPSIEQLALYLLQLQSGGSKGVDAAAAAHQKMLDMVERFSARVIQRQNPTPAPSDQVVVLTGATGSLGAHILTQLVASSSVARVVCLSRAKSHADSLDRVKASLATRLCSLPPHQLGKISSLAADPSLPHLGLTPAEHAQLAQSCTAVIHNAWPVNFILSLDSYDEHITGAVNLLNLAQSSERGAAFYFSSSVGTRQGRPEPHGVTEDFADSPATAAGTGYGRSKWVVEKIMQASAAKGATARVLRIGQLVGDTTHGVWNETEAWPLMFRSAKVIGALPNLDEQPAWLPVDLAARAIAEIVTAPSPSARTGTPQGTAQVYHILNARPAPWSAILDGLRAAGLQFEAVERREWVARLAASNPDPAQNPTYKLLDFYANRIGQATERAAIDFEVKRTSEMSHTIAECQPVDSRLMELWARHWQETGFL